MTDGDGDTRAGAGDAAVGPVPTEGGPWFEVAVLSHAGTVRPHNEDACGYAQHGPRSTLVVVADGVSSQIGAEVASQTAVEVTLAAFAEQPISAPAPRRLARAVQQANIKVYDLATIVPELRGMATTLTAVALDGEWLWGAHVGDSRLYLLRDGRLTQLTKDHTVAAERQRMGLLSAARARHHPDRGTLTRSLGRDLIVALDRLSTRIASGDVLILCTDGLYNAIDDVLLGSLAAADSAAAACQALIGAANRAGTADNLSAAVVRVVGSLPPLTRSTSVGSRLRRLIRRTRA